RRAEQPVQPGAHAPHELLDRRLAVRRAEHARVRGEVVELFAPDLRRTAPEPAVGGQQVAGDHEFRHTRDSMGGRIRPRFGAPNRLACVTDLVDTTEMYLRTILDLEEEGIVPLRARISERLE